jgi:hypothetical protein
MLDDYLLMVLYWSVNHLSWCLIIFFYYYFWVPHLLYCICIVYTVSRIPWSISAAKEGRRHVMRYGSWRSVFQAKKITSKKKNVEGWSLGECGWMIPFSSRLWVLAFWYRCVHSDAQSKIPRAILGSCHRSYKNCLCWKGVRLVHFAYTLRATSLLRSLSLNIKWFLGIKLKVLRFITCSTMPSILQILSWFSPPRPLEINIEWIHSCLLHYWKTGTLL